MVFCTAIKVSRQYLMVLLLFVLASCGQDEQKELSNILPEQKMIELMADLHLIDAMAKERILEHNSNPVVKTAQMKVILYEYNISEEQFDQILRDYTEDPEAFYEFYEKVINELNVRLTRIEAKKMADEEKSSSQKD